MPAVVATLVLGVIGMVGLLGLVAARAAEHPRPLLRSAAGGGAGIIYQATVKPASGSTQLAVPVSEIPNGLVSGACVAFPPTGRDLRQTVFVDPGHGGPDPGAVSGTAVEKDLALAVGLRLRDQLVAAGYRVVMARVADTSVARLLDSQVRSGAITESGVHLDTQARIACANAARAAALVSIHFDAFDDPAVGGAETFYDDAREFGPANFRLATLLQAGMQAAFERAGLAVDDRGVVSDAETGSSGLTAEGDAYGRLMELGPAKPGWNEQPSRMPGALVEPIFLTNPSEATLALSPEGQAAIAAGLADGLTRFLAPSASASAA